MKISKLVKRGCENLVKDGNFNWESYSYKSLCILLGTKPIVEVFKIMAESFVVPMMTINILDIWYVQGRIIPLS
jgi:hypothetical protein